VDSPQFSGFLLQSTTQALHTVDAFLVSLRIMNDFALERLNILLALIAASRSCSGQRYLSLHYIPVAKCSCLWVGETEYLKLLGSLIS
jgi:hypothetical protein